MGKRFYQIAIDLGLQPRSFIRELSDVGLSVGNQMIIIPDELETRIHEMYETLHPTVDPSTPSTIPSEEIGADEAGDEAVATAAGEAGGAGAVGPVQAGASSRAGAPV